MYSRATGGPADHFCDQVFESRRGTRTVRSTSSTRGFAFNLGVNHDAVNEVINEPFLCWTFSGEVGLPHNMPHRVRPASLGSSAAATAAPRYEFAMPYCL